MTFVDEVDVEVRAGRGGDGSAAMRSEPYKPKGGPEGGDGGPRRRRRVPSDPQPARPRLVRGPSTSPRRARQARRPRPPRRRQRQGPRRERSRTAPSSSTSEGCSPTSWAKGPRPSWRGAAAAAAATSRFAGPKNRVPRTAESGEAGEERRLHVELRTVADLGLIGLAERREVDAPVPPDGREPKIADYPFTTLTPEPGRRRSGRRTVRRRRHPRPGRGRPRRQGARGSVPPPHHAMSRARPRRRPLVSGRTVRIWTPSGRSSGPTTRSSRSGHRSSWAPRRTSSRTRRAPRTRSAGCRCPPLTGEGLDLLGSQLEAAVAPRERPSSRLAPPTWCSGRAGPVSPSRGRVGGWRVVGRNVERWVLETNLDDERAARRPPTAS